MEKVGYNTFFTLEEAKAQAAAKHMECRRVFQRMSARTKDAMFVSHSTLLQLKGMIATMDFRPEYNPDLIHVTVEDRSDLRRIAGMKFHYWKQDIDVIELDELVSGVSAMQAVCQLAQYTDLTSLVVAMDWLTCANKDLRVCTHQELVDYIDGLGKFVGGPLCRRALRLSKEGTDSPQETILRLAGNEYGLPEAEVNYELFDHIRGSGTLKVDIAYPDDHVCIEYDGRYHYTQDRWEADLEKRNRIKDLGMMPFVATRKTLATKESRNEFFAMVARAIAEYRREGRFVSSVGGF